MSDTRNKTTTAPESKQPSRAKPWFNLTTLSDSVNNIQTFIQEYQKKALKVPFTNRAKYFTDDDFKEVLDSYDTVETDKLKSGLFIESKASDKHKNVITIKTTIDSKYVKLMQAKEPPNEYTDFQKTQWETNKKEWEDKFKKLWEEHQKRFSVYYSIVDKNKYAEAVIAIRRIIKEMKQLNEKLTEKYGHFDSSVKNTWPCLRNADGSLRLDSENNLMMDPLLDNPVISGYQNNIKTLASQIQLASQKSFSVNADGKAKIEFLIAEADKIMLNHTSQIARINKKYNDEMEQARIQKIAELEKTKLELTTTLATQMNTIKTLEEQNTALNTKLNTLQKIFEENAKEGDHLKIVEEKANQLSQLSERAKALPSLREPLLPFTSPPPAKTQPKGTWKAPTYSGLVLGGAVLAVGLAIVFWPVTVAGIAISVTAGIVAAAVGAGMALLSGIYGAVSSHKESKASNQKTGITSNTSSSSLSDSASSQSSGSRSPGQVSSPRIERRAEPVSSAPAPSPRVSQAGVFATPAEKQNGAAPAKSESVSKTQAPGSKP